MNVSPGIATAAQRYPPGGPRKAIHASRIQNVMHFVQHLLCKE